MTYEERRPIDTRCKNLNFELTSAQHEIVRQVRSLCTKFPDEYWRERDALAEFPQDFFEAIAKEVTWVSRFRRSMEGVASGSRRLR